MKQTVEEAARTHWNESTYNKDAELAYDERDCIAIKALAKAIALRAFKEGATWQAKQSLWISVEERLPKEGQKVFVLVMCYGTPCIREEKFCRNSNLDKKGMWIHGKQYRVSLDADSFIHDILEANRDVLERIKEKGD